jgi:bacillithiol synthase
VATASDSSSWRKRADLDLVALELMPALPGAFLSGRDRDLLAPLEFLEPGAAPAAYRGAVDRRALAAGLAEANAAYGHPAAAEMSRKLADPAVAVVATGQQPGLFGGPLYTLSKAVAAARWAAELEAAGRPAVAVFWMGTEDHDFRESSWALFHTPGGLRRVDLGEDGQELMPLGMRSLGDGVTNALDALRDAVPGERFADWLDLLERWYRPTARFGEAFARLLARLLGERCPLLLDAMLPAAKQAQRHVLRRLVERRTEVDHALAAASDAVVARGYELQVKPQPGASPLFFLHGGERRRIVWGDGETWSLRGEEGPLRPLGQLLAAIADNPSVVMPGVLARPLVQDAILGTTLQVMGPGEISYLPQLAPLYATLEVDAPATALRPQLLVMPAHETKKLADTGLELADLVRVDFDLDRAAARGEDTERMRPAEAALDELERTLEQAAEPVAQEMDSALRKTGEQLRRGLEHFAQRLTAALARSHQVRRDRLAHLAGWVRPGGVLQERALSTADLPGRYGPALVDAMFDQLELDGRRLQVIEP